MTELYELLKQMNIPVAYHHFVQETNPPFITYYRTDTNNFYADNKVYEKINNYRVELYTRQKDVVLESQLETILDDNDITYEVEAEAYIKEEDVYQVIYKINI